MKGIAMTEQNQNQNQSNTDIDSFDIDNLDLDDMLGDIANTAVEGGFDAETAEDDCPGGACKI